MGRSFFIVFNVTCAVFVSTNLALVLTPQVPWIWEPNIIDAVRWTGWPLRFIGFGGFVGNWEVNLPAMWINVTVMFAVALLTGFATQKFADRWRKPWQTSDPYHS